MTPPEVQPVYLVVPSLGWEEPEMSEVDSTIAGFVDALAMDPAVAERVLLSVVEYSTFVNELSPLGRGLEDAAHVSVSRFEGVSYAASFEGLARLLEYDRYRLSEDGVRAGRPVVAIVVHTAPSPDDGWGNHHRSLVDADGEAARSAPVIAAVATVASAQSFAEGIAFPAQHSAVAVNPLDAGGLAASIVVRTLACGRLAHTWPGGSVCNSWTEHLCRAT